ncbi:MAG: hypothetical protein A2015_15570 [Spirochaetes bacterium GWF1_31_7]|nr:MAG: hypothetical protein A2Y30_01585 [Spirochaetes bacterium GWE1_32_154]OHD47041.1 MAG: hypothetical protein A2Y29_06480 [Spirochaetes bacterium GWE2_31_10]OHD53047.1 MAG: hypothetical protein A2015_15570 [Spirochaetes bacterium GWF1_31_7]HBD94834.1 hypothetical protein [Spirochaetia bacterium]
MKYMPKRNNRDSRKNILFILNFCFNLFLLVNSRKQIITILFLLGYILVWCEEIDITILSDYFNMKVEYDVSRSIIEYSNDSLHLKILYGSAYVEINNNLVFLDDIIKLSNGKVRINETGFNKILKKISNKNIQYSYFDAQITADEVEQTKEENNQQFIYTKKPEKISINAIVIDAGHGGSDPGTYRGQVVEKQITLKTALKLEKVLKEKFPEKKIIMTRRTDVFVPLENRSKIANDTMKKYGHTIFLSIHVNASISTKPYGFETWYIVDDYKRNIIEKGYASNDKDIENILNSMANDELYIDSKKLATEIQNNLNIQIGNVSKDRGVKENTYIVVKNSIMPAVLVEIGFLSNNYEAKRLTNESYSNKIIAGIFKGMCDFINEYESIIGF